MLTQRTMLSKVTSALQTRGTHAYQRLQGLQMLGHLPVIRDGLCAHGAGDPMGRSLHQLGQLVGNSPLQPIVVSKPARC
jgi:hypothetical protein